MSVTGHISETDDLAGMHSEHATLDPSQVRQQLERLLASPHIRNSKRCRDLLTYVVEAYLGGSLDRIKERTVGVEVFHRAPDYDANEDSVVRTAALEIRKRLGQYYSDAGHERELRVLLPPGSYIPEFRLPPPLPAAVSIPPPLPASEPATARAARRSWRIWAAAAAAVLAISAVFAIWLNSRPTELDRFWAPLLQDRADALLCVEQPLRIYRFEGPRFDELNQIMVGNGNVPPASDEERRNANIRLSELKSAGERYFANGDMMSTLRVVELLARKGKAFQVLGDRATSYRDLRGRPAVLIGEFNHIWFPRLVSGLRYYLDKDYAKRLYMVRDSFAQGRVIASTTSDENRPEEYVVISRLFPASTEKMVIAVSSMTFRGNAASGDFLTNAAYLRDALKDAPPGWDRKNLQIVIKATLVSGMAGPPRVIAKHYW
jgi:hypothetical protein